MITPAAGNNIIPSGYLSGTPPSSPHPSVSEASRTASFTPRVTSPDKQDQTASNRTPETDPGNPTDSNRTATAPQQTGQTVNGRVLSEAEMRLLNELKQTDAEVRRHETAHIAAGGRYITSGANFTYKRGPDGRNYAVGGEVSIDTSPVPGDPEATIRKMRQVRSSALAPATPSAQDLKVASKASALASEAMSELMMMTAKETAQDNEVAAFGNIRNAEDTYARVNESPERHSSSFRIAV